ncbi:ribosomal protein S10 [Lophium mytilinum]|uniref:Small ribosomal subunit protein uS10m n=1 Tax=Lophium mytilinum TaxID=390894 RepID=A0A6A6QEI5_9PEZI|nr:ribosomal protein S10 [Lophium mytilinum]
MEAAVDEAVSQIKEFSRFEELKADPRFKEPKTEKEMRRKWKELQSAPDHTNVLEMWKEAGVEPIELAKKRGLKLPGDERPPLDPEVAKQLSALREPRNVQAIHLNPLRRSAEHGVPVCDLQLRTYSIRNLEFFADFAMRAAYYLGLPAKGPIPLPRITERWTVPRANFVFKKSQENFERITMRRLIQIQDGHPEVVQAWLAFLAKHQYYGVGMKANVFQFEALGEQHEGPEIVGKVDTSKQDPKMMKKVEELLNQDQFKKAFAQARAEKAPEVSA